VDRRKARTHSTATGGEENHFEHDQTVEFYYWRQIGPYMHLTRNVFLPLPKRPDEQGIENNFLPCDKKFDKA
jgi:hypothetical protein